MLDLKITEILGRSSQGATRPYICRCDNKSIYFVKGLDASRESKVKEFVAAHLARSLKLPIADFALVYASSALNQLPICKGLGTGFSFGSKKTQVTELTYSDIKNVPSDIQTDVLAFDWWIHNLDRTLTEKGGNPNLFWKPENKALMVIDHNLAFDVDFSTQDFMNYHVFKDKIPKLFDDLVTRNEYLVRFEEALNMWDDICEKIPESWSFIDEDMSIPAKFDLQEMKTILDRIKQLDFWDLR